MNATVREWLAKAEGDYQVARRESAVADGPCYDAVCFHAQQCAEKLLKGALIHYAVVPPKTHDLGVLQTLLLPHAAECRTPEEDLRFLTRAAVEYRYPGDSATREDAVEALRVCRDLRTRILGSFGMPL